MIHAQLQTAPYRVPNWLPQDTEESIVGTEWHQEATGAVADILREAAFRNHLSWGVCEEIALHGLSAVLQEGRGFVMDLTHLTVSGLCEACRSHQ